MFCPQWLVIESSPAIRFRHNRADVGSRTLNAKGYGLPFGRVAVSVSPVEHSSPVEFVITLTAHLRHEGREFTLDSRKMAVISPQKPTEQIIETGCSHFTVKLDRKQIEDFFGKTSARRSALIFLTNTVCISGVAASIVQFAHAIICEMDGTTPAYTHHSTVWTWESMLCQPAAGRGAARHP